MTWKKVVGFLRIRIPLPTFSKRRDFTDASKTNNFDKTDKEGKMTFWQKIRAIWIARKLFNEAKKEVKTMDGVKPGVLTTEFWGKTLVQIVVLYNTFAGAHIDPQLAMQTVAVIEALYHALRAVVKVAKEIGAAIKKPQA